MQGPCPLVNCILFCIFNAETEDDESDDEEDEMENQVTSENVPSVGPLTALPSSSGGRMPLANNLNLNIK